MYWYDDSYFCFEFFFDLVINIIFGTKHSCALIIYRIYLQKYEKNAMTTVDIGSRYFYLKFDIMHPNALNKDDEYKEFEKNKNKTHQQFKISPS